VLQFDYVMSRHHARITWMKLSSEPLSLEPFEDRVNPEATMKAGPSNRLARKYRIGLSRERAIRTVLPDFARRTNEPNI
jgi:hypothetical protein